jgi:hypothetical protein
VPIPELAVAVEEVAVVSDKKELLSKRTGRVHDGGGDRAGPDAGV